MLAAFSGRKGEKEVGESVCFVWLSVSGSAYRQLEKRFPYTLSIERLAHQQRLPFRAARRVGDIDYIATNPPIRLCSMRAFSVQPALGTRQGALFSAGKFCLPNQENISKVIGVSYHSRATIQGALERS